MILTVESDQIEFLGNLYNEIKRILASQLTESEKTHNDYHLIEQGNLFKSTNLPCNFSIEKHYQNIGGCGNKKTIKLKILIGIYNQTAQNFQKGGTIDIGNIFSDVKQKFRNAFSDYGYSLDIDSGMKSHRSHFYHENLVGRLISFLYQPTSASFLKKYGFFEAKMNDVPSKTLDHFYSIVYK